MKEMIVGAMQLIPTLVKITSSSMGGNLTNSMVINKVCSFRVDGTLAYLGDMRWFFKGFHFVGDFLFPFGHKTMDLTSKVQYQLLVGIFPHLDHYTIN